MKPQISDEDFLSWFDLTRPAMAEARILMADGRTHQAALATAKAAPEGPVRAVIHGQDVKATGELIARHFPRAIDLEFETIRLWEMAEIPSMDELGASDDARIGHRARVGRSRGNDALMAALVFGVTGDRHYADLASRWGLLNAARIPPMPQVDRPAAYPWHPHSDTDTVSQDVAHQLQYWMQAWGVLHHILIDEDRLTWMKTIISAARDRLKANRDEIGHNLTLHALVPSLMVAAAFPSLVESTAWLARWRDLLLKRFCRPPFVTPDGYTREGCSYHNVNLRLLTLMHLVFDRALGEDAPELRSICRGGYEIQAMFTCPDGSHWRIGDGMTRAHHEHWQDAHESLHLGAALFDEPRWKAAAGSLAGTNPELLNLWLMGSEGIERWLKMPGINLSSRQHQSATAHQSGIAVLRGGRGTDAHAGMLCFTTEHNHAHHDKGQALIYGLGRHLITDPGFESYGSGDMNPMYSAKCHAVASPIRRTPMGPRTDHSEWAGLLGRYSGTGIEIAAGEHRLYDNHIIRRALALAMPWGDNGPAIWIIWDRIDWKSPWPSDSFEPLDLIDTKFPLQTPEHKAKISTDGRSVWSLHAGPALGVSRTSGDDLSDMFAADELSDSDANIQITRLDYPQSVTGESPLGDLIIQPGIVCRFPGQTWPRPLATYRWRGRLPHVAAYALIPYHGLPESPHAQVIGQATPDGVFARVTLPHGTADIHLDALSTSHVNGRTQIEKHRP